MPSTATQLDVPWSSSSCVGLGSSLSLILKATPSRLTVQGRAVSSAAQLGRSPGPARILPASRHPSPTPMCSKPPRNGKQMSLLQEKVIYITEYFRASKDEKRFITWGRRLMLVESSHTEGADVFYGEWRGGNALV